MKPHKCPVCDGTGKVSRPPHIAGDIEGWLDSSCGPYTCQACNGTGILWKPDSIDYGDMLPKLEYKAGG